MLGTLNGPWLPCTAILLLMIAVRRWPRPELRELCQAGFLVAGAAFARLALGVWGPLHVNGQGPLWIRGALERGGLAAYGPGYYELFHWVTHLGVAPDRAIFAANALLSAICPALLYATARLIGVGRGGALAAAAVLAADLVTILTAASELYIWPQITLIVAMQLALALFVRADVDGRSLDSALALIAAGLLGAATARIQATGYLPLALSPLVVLGAARPQGWAARLPLTAEAVAAIGGAVLLTSAEIVLTAQYTSSVTGQALFAGLGKQYLTLLAALLAGAVALRRWARPPWLPLLAVASIALVPFFANSFQRHPFQVLFYSRLCLPGVLLGAAALLPQRRQAPGWALGVAAGAALALSIPAWPYVGARTTEQLEYRFLQETLPSLPSNCVLASVARARKRVWSIPNYLLASQRFREIEGVADLRDAAAAESCVVYVRPSLCTSMEARVLCEAIEREVPLERIAARVFPGAPSDLDLPYDRSEVEVVVFRTSIRRPSP